MTRTFSAVPSSDKRHESSEKKDNSEDISNNDTKSTDNTGAGTGNFMLGILVPLIGFYFISFKLYSSSFDDPLARADISSKIAILKILLLVIIFSTMYALNTTSMKKMCPNGTKNLVTKVFFSTFIPFVFLFGTIVVALSLMPGWKAPFSNTLGYSLVKNVMFRKLFSLQDWLKEGETEGDSELAKFNQRSNRTFFVNELTPENFFQAIDSLNIQFKEAGDGEVDYPVKKLLYKAVIVKDFISEFIWLLVTSLLTFSLSQIYILNNSCEPDVDSMIERDKLDELNAENNDDEDDENF
jgi:hypothetical protein